MSLVLREAAHMLGLDQHLVESTGVLLVGEKELKEVQTLEAGQVHKVTLVLE